METDEGGSAALLAEFGPGNRGLPPQPGQGCGRRSGTTRYGGAHGVAALATNPPGVGAYNWNTCIHPVSTITKFPSASR